MRNIVLGSYVVEAILDHRDDFEDVPICLITSKQCNVAVTDPILPEKNTLLGSMERL